MSRTETMVTDLQKWAARAPDQPALHGGEPDALTTLSWAQYLDAVHSVGKALIALGVEPGDTVALRGSSPGASQNLRGADRAAANDWSGGGGSDP